MSKTLVITGSSRGIGYALVELASADGHQVYALSRNISAIKKTNLAHPFSIDITVKNSLESFVDQIQLVHQFFTMKDMFSKVQSI